MTNVKGTLSVDQNSRAIPVMSPGSDANDVFPLDGSVGEAHTSIFSEGRIVKLISVTGNFYVAIGVDSLATSNHDLIPQGAIVYYSVRNGERVSIFGTDSVYVTKLQ